MPLQRSCLADGCVGEIKLEAIRASGSKMKEYNMLAETLSNAPEMVLYHGTSRERMELIAKHGLQVRFAQGGADDGQVEQKVGTSGWVGGVPEVRQVVPAGR